MSQLTRSPFLKSRSTISAALSTAKPIILPTQHHRATTPGRVRVRSSSDYHNVLSLHYNATAIGADTDTLRQQSQHHRQRRWSSSSSASNSPSDEYTAEQRKQDHKHCVEMVQTRDMEGYLCGLLMPSSAREAYFALRAFNVEIASIKDASQLIGGRSRGSRGMDEGGNNAAGDSSLASRLRMQWWRDAIAEIYDNARDNDNSQSKGTSSQPKDSILSSLTSSRKRNPTLRSLHHAIHTHGLTHRFLRRIMEAREVDLEVVQYERFRDVAQYGEDTVSNVLYLSLETVGIRDEASDVVASDIGVGLGILTALRSTGFRATQGECSIPSDLAAKHSVSMDTLWRAWDASINTPDDVNKMDEAASSQEALRNATREMADIASFHLYRARDNQSSVPKEGRPCLLPAVCGLQYLNSLKEVNYDVLHPSLVGGGESAAGLERRRRLGLMFLLGRTWLTGTF